MKALLIANSQGFGILCIICDDPKTVDSVLKEGGYITTFSDVLAAAVLAGAGIKTQIRKICFNYRLKFTPSASAEGI